MSLQALGGVNGRKLESNRDGLLPSRVPENKCAVHGALSPLSPEAFTMDQITALHGVGGLDYSQQ